MITQGISVQLSTPTCNLQAMALRIQSSLGQEFPHESEKPNPPATDHTVIYLSLQLISPVALSLNESLNNKEETNQNHQFTFSSATVHNSYSTLY